jgi:sugar phosphate isomerase/epimerase
MSDAAQKRGMTAVQEFFPWKAVPDLSTDLAIVQALGEHADLLVDALHFSRSRLALSLLASLLPDRLPFAHLCDVPVLQSYREEQMLHSAHSDRLAPDDGAIEHENLLRALPSGIPFALEIPSPAVEAHAELILRR